MAVVHRHVRSVPKSTQDISVEMAALVDRHNRVGHPKDCSLEMVAAAAAAVVVVVADTVELFRAYFSYVST